jgi:hypothetical protein
MPHVSHAVRFPEDAVATLEEPDLPFGWNRRPESTSSAVVEPGRSRAGRSGLPP